MSHNVDFLPHEGTPGPVPLQELVTEYLEDLELRGRGALTVKRYRGSLQAFTRWLAAQTGRRQQALTSADIDQERLRAFQLFLTRRGDPRTNRVLLPATRNGYASALSGLVTYGRRRRHLPLPDPEVAVMRAKKRDVQVRYLSREEVDRLREAVDLAKPTGLRDRALVEALFGSGARVSELAAMTVRGFDPKRREVEIIGKGSRSRIVFLTPEAAGWIERYLNTRSDDHTALFVTSKGDPRALGVRQIERIVGSLAVRARLSVRVSPHWLRHSRLTIVARHSGVEVAQKVAGHSSLQTTARYLHVTDAQLRALYDKAEQADRDGS